MHARRVSVSALASLAGVAVLAGCYYLGALSAPEIYRPTSRTAVAGTWIGETQGSRIELQADGDFVMTSVPVYAVAGVDEYDHETAEWWFGHSLPELTTPVDAAGSWRLPGPSADVWPSVSLCYSQPIPDVTDEPNECATQGDFRVHRGEVLFMITLGDADAGSYYAFRRDPALLLKDL